MQAAEELAMEEVEAQEARRDFWSLGGAPGFSDFWRCFVMMNLEIHKLGKLRKSGQALGAKMPNLLY